MGKQEYPQKQRQEHLEKLYELLAKLERGQGDKRRLGDCTGKLHWPRRGLYLFFDPGEYRRGDTRTLRVVRVGTHAVRAASKSTLWQRLRQHRGLKRGGGDHRCSIFRGHVGRALQRRNGLTCPSWGQKGRAFTKVRGQETQFEQAVSTYLADMMLLYVAIGDGPTTSSDRGYLERNAIALLTSQIPPSDQPSPNWLGHYSPEDRIRASGLWNLDYVGEPYDEYFLDVLAEHIDATINIQAEPAVPPNDSFDEGDVLTCFALRLDGLKYQTDTGFMLDGIIERYWQTGVWPSSDLEKLATFFMFQRGLCKWDLIYEPKHGKYWRTFRELFFLVAPLPVPGKYRDPEWYRRWKQQYHPHLALCVESVRGVHEATAYDDNAKPDF